MPKYTSKPDHAAFPRLEGAVGLSTRQYVAIHILQGLMAGTPQGAQRSTLARDAVIFADQLLAELEKDKP